MAFEPSENPITNPTRESYTELRPFRFWCQKVLPLVYDDSLSYYELLCKVVDYLNKTMEDVDHMNTDMDTLYSNFQQFQEGTIRIYNELVDYVNTYFAELDVQDEIDNKLDAMVTSGELVTILQPSIANEVASWLAEHITPTTPIIDNTLRISGAAADAKVVGDNLFNLKSSFANLSLNHYNNPLYAFDYNEIYGISKRMMQVFVNQSQANRADLIDEAYIEIEPNKYYTITGLFQALIQPEFFQSMTLRVYIFDASKTPLDTYQLGSPNDGPLTFRTTNTNARFIRLALFWIKDSDHGTSHYETFGVDLLIVERQIYLSETINIDNHLGRLTDAENAIQGIKEGELDGYRYITKYVNGAFNKNPPSLVGGNTRIRPETYTKVSKGDIIEVITGSYKHSIVIYAGTLESCTINFEATWTNSNQNYDVKEDGFFIIIFADPTDDTTVIDPDDFDGSVKITSYAKRNVDTLKNKTNNTFEGIYQFDKFSFGFGARYPSDVGSIVYARNIITCLTPLNIEHTTQIVVRRGGNYRFRIYRASSTGTYITNSDSGWLNMPFTVYAGETIYINIEDSGKTSSEWTDVTECLDNVYMLQPWTYNEDRLFERDIIPVNDRIYCANNTFKRIYNPYKLGGSMTLTGQMHCHVKQASGQDTYTKQDLADKLYEGGYDFFTITDYARFGITTPPSDLHGMIWIGNSYEANYGPWGTDLGDDAGEHIITWNARGLYVKQNTSHTNIQEVIDWCRDNNCIPSYPHPYVESDPPQPVTKASRILHGLRFCEIYNGASVQAYSNLVGENYDCEKMWRALLKQGNFTFGIGVSDSHDLLDYQTKNGVIKVFANAKTREAIMESLLAGNFYVSSYAGYSIGSVVIEEGKYKIDTAHDGATVKFFDENGTELLSTTGRNVEYAFAGTERLVWARIEHPSPTYARFWTQPVFINQKMY